MKINTRQLSVIIFYVLTSLKLLALPSLIYLICKNDSWLVFVFMVMIDIALTSIILTFLHQSEQSNFYEFLKQRFGVVFAKIFCFAFLLVFLLDLLDGTTGVQRLLLNNFYIELKWYVYLIPQLCILAYIAYKGLRNIGRLCELFFWILIAGILFIVLKSLTDFDMTFFMPFLSEGISPIFKALFKHISWYGTPVALLFMMGEVDFRDCKKSRYVKYFLISAFFVILTTTAFYGVFKGNAGLHSFAISDLGEIANSSTALDELSWLIVSLWVIAQTLQLTIVFYSAIFAFRYLFNIKNSWWPIFVLILIVIGYHFINNNSVDIARYFYSWPVALGGISIKIVLVIFIAIANVFYLKKHGGKSNGKT